METDSPHPDPYVPERNEPLVAGVSNKIGSVLVVGSGISGMQAALDLADGGYYVYLLDSEPAIGGLMSKLDKTFPTNDCAMCVMSPKLVDCGRHLNIELVTYADVKNIDGVPGNYNVEIVRKAKSVDEEKCTGCGDCVTGCPSRYVVRPPAEGALYEPETTADERDFIDRLLREEEDVEGNLLSVLQDVSEYSRYLPEHVLKYLSDKTGIPLARMISVATFYDAFSLEPRGEHTISVCMGTACHVKGSGLLQSRLEDILQIQSGETTADGKFTLQTVRCIGCCALAPAVRIDEETFGFVMVRGLEKILNRF
jgi:heterodisulfide reductase subunit A